MYSLVLYSLALLLQVGHFITNYL